MRWGNPSARKQEEWRRERSLPKHQLRQSGGIRSIDKCCFSAHTSQRLLGKQTRAKHTATSGDGVQVTQTQPCAGSGRNATHTYTHTQVHILADTVMHTPSHTRMRRDAHLEAPGELTRGDSVLDQGLGTPELRGRPRALGCCADSGGAARRLVCAHGCEELTALWIWAQAY